jgi:hypothetical protein
MILDSCRHDGSNEKTTAQTPYLYDPEPTQIQVFTKRAFCHFSSCVLMASGMITLTANPVELFSANDELERFARDLDLPGGFPHVYLHAYNAMLG